MAKIKTEFVEINGKQGDAAEIKGNKFISPRKLMVGERKISPIALVRNLIHQTLKKGRWIKIKNGSSI